MRKSLHAMMLALALLVPTLAACGNPGPATTTTPGVVAPTGQDTGGAATPSGNAVTVPTAAATDVALRETPGNGEGTTVPTAQGGPTNAPAPTNAPLATAGATTGGTAAATTTGGTTGTATTGGTAGSGQKLKVGLVTDVGKINDGTFNQYAYEGLQRAERELGIETAFIETQAQTDYARNFDQFASQNFDMVIGVGFLMGDALKEAATKYPNIKFAIVDFAYDPPLPNVRAMVFAEDEAGYLAGALAAQMSKANNIAVVGGVDIPPVRKFVLGYENGAKSVKPDVTVQQIYTGSFTDRALGGETARNFISQGADVIMGAGGQTGSGGIQTAAQSGVYVIGVDQDEYNTTFQKGAAPGADRLLSSALKRVDNAVFQAVEAAVKGTFKGETQVNNASTGGIGLAPYHGTEAEVPAEVKQKMDEILKGLSDGTIKTNVTLQ